MPSELEEGIPVREKKCFNGFSSPFSYFLFSIPIPYMPVSLCPEHLVVRIGNVLELRRSSYMVSHCE